jgi:23S rRNA (pseudouridine1915-N3)-methyltransferase
MKIKILSIGKWKACPERELFELYKKRITWELTLQELDPKKNDEAEIILKSLPENTFTIALDECGKQFSSIELSEQMDSWMSHGTSHITFVIGGADGLSSSILNKADLKLSFGKMTYPHMMVRPILAEQIYRVETILKGHPYHRS